MSFVAARNRIKVYIHRVQIAIARNEKKKFVPHSAIIQVTVDEVRLKIGRKGPLERIASGMS